MYFVIIIIIMTFMSKLITCHGLACLALRNSIDINLGV